LKASLSINPMEERTKFADALARLLDAAIL